MKIQLKNKSEWLKYSHCTFLSFFFFCNSRLVSVRKQSVWRVDDDDDNDDDDDSSLSAKISMLQTACSLPWTTTIIKLIIFVTYGACRVYLYCHNPQSLTQSTGSLSCAQMLMHAIAHGGVRTLKESVHWKLTLGRKSMAAPGNGTCISGMTTELSPHPAGDHPQMYPPPPPFQSLHRQY